MGFIDFFRDLLISKPNDGKYELYQIEVAKKDFAVQLLAFQAAKNKIANAFAKCEIQKLENGKKVEDEDHYRFNYEPNRNQSASEFKKRLISKLLVGNECLIIEIGGEYFIADSFTKETDGIKGSKYRDITVNNKTVKKTCSENNVLYFKLNNDNITGLVNTLSKTYSDIIQYSEASYRRSKGRKAVLNIEARASSNPKFSENVDKLYNKDLRSFFKADNAVLPLFDGFNYDELTAVKGATDANTRDIKAQIDDVFDFTARAFNIPVGLLKGDIVDTEQMTHDLLTYCIEPITKLIEDELIRKKIGLTGFIYGNTFKVSTSRITNVDIIKSATAVDKLIASGVCSINEIRERFKLERLDEDWASKHFITKNYTTFTDLENSEKGGN